MVFMQMLMQIEILCWLIKARATFSGLSQRETCDLLLVGLSTGMFITHVCILYIRAFEYKCLFLFVCVLN